MTIDELMKEAFRIGQEHGFHANEGVGEERARHIPGKIALIHSEASEALEHYRNGNSGAKLNEIWFQSDKPDKPDGFAVELADVVIRVADLAAMFDIDLTAAVKAKMKYNESRSHLHGGKKC